MEEKNKVYELVENFAGHGSLTSIRKNDAGDVYVQITPCMIGYGYPRLNLNQIEYLFKEMRKKKNGA
jgi:hypothetical protein